LKPLDYHLLEENVINLGGQTGQKDKQWSSYKDGLVSFEAAFGEKPTHMSGVFFWEAKLVGFSGGRGT